jgi:hypothetical protein
MQPMGWYEPCNGRVQPAVELATPEPAAEAEVPWSLSENCLP